nr:probable rhamnogalacturonate lyase B [Tanacetum cinerariifolium]
MSKTWKAWGVFGQGYERRTVPRVATIVKLSVAAKLSYMPEEVAASCAGGYVKSKVSENLNVSISYRIDSLDVARARRSPKADVADTGVNLSFQDNHVIVSNGIVQITLSNPEGHLTSIQYKGVDNLLEAANNETDRGYWDLVWSPPRSLVTTGTFDRKRYMPLPGDRFSNRGKQLAYPEAVLLVNPVEPEFKGHVIIDPAIGFWQITPSNEFRIGGPKKQELTSHVGPVNLANQHFQMLDEVAKWPYSFPASKDFKQAHERGMISGRLFVYDRFISYEHMLRNGSYIGLAKPEDLGSWERENKGYQFWSKTNDEGHFSIENILAGTYNIYPWIDGFIGCHIEVGDLVFEPPGDGLTLWEIGIPDRSAAEFYIPNPDPMFSNKFLDNDQNRFRQYGLWERYATLYPDVDLVFTIGESDYKKDWFFAHVTRKTEESTYEKTTWTIKFKLENVNINGTYKLRVALASAHVSDLQIRMNDPNNDSALFSTGIIGGDNVIARHGIHGLYWLFCIDIPRSELNSNAQNSNYLTQGNDGTPFSGVMYDYIRLEGPHTS